MEPLEVEDFIKVNNLVPISSPIFFASDGSPDPNGLLSNQIFGITQNDRSNIFSYIHLGDHTFINPVFYKVLTTLDSKVVGIVHGTDTYSLDDNISREIIRDSNLCFECLLFPLYDEYIDSIFSGTPLSMKNRL